MGLMKSPALLVTAPNTIELSEVEIPEPDAGEVLVQAELTTISPGTELRCMAGGQEGADKYPFIPGYAMLGRVLRTGTGGEGRVGQRVFCTGTRRVEGANRVWGGHTAFAVCDAARIYHVPEGVTDENAALTRLAGISFHGYRMTLSGALDDVVVVGLGPIGMLSALIHKAAGANVMAVDPLPARCALATRLGIPSFAPNDPDARQHLPNLASVVVDSTGVPAVLPSALEWLREPTWQSDSNPRGYLVVQGSYGAKEIGVAYQDAFRREATILVPRDACPPDFRDVLAWCEAGKMDLSPLLSAIFAPTEAPDVYRRLAAKDPALITAAFRWF